MITIQEYFDNIQELEGMEARFDAEDAAMELFENDIDNDSTDFTDWLEMAGIDPEATTTLKSGHTVKWLTIWFWDMDD